MFLPRTRGTLLLTTAVVLLLSIAALRFYTTSSRPGLVQHIHFTQVPVSENSKPPGPVAQGPPLELTDDEHVKTTSSGWRFTAERDALNYGLADDQCDVAFPRLWKELDRAVEHFYATRNVTVADVDISWREDAMVRAMIYDRKVYIIDLRGCMTNRHHRERALATLHDISRSITAYNGPIPNIEFSICVEDFAYRDTSSAPPSSSAPITWSYTRLPSHSNIVLMPDFGFYSWPIEPIGDYADFRREVADTAPTFEAKIPKALWRGAPLNQQRKDLLKEAEGKSWADVKAVSWKWWKWWSKKDMLMASGFCGWQYVVHTEGRSYSGRLKYLLNCHSVPVIPSLQWLENFHHLLSPSGPSQNFVPIQGDFSDLSSQMNHYLSDSAAARRIADNAAATFGNRYLTPAAQACYWRKMFEAWRKVSFTPEFYREDTKGKRVARGISLETYMLLDVYDDNPWKQ